MSTKRTFLRRPHRTALTGNQELDLWLGVGPPCDPRPFASAEARKAAWQLHRDRLSGVLPSSPGRRAMAFWQYDAPIAWPGYERERSVLYDAGLLGEEEAHALEIEWRADFTRSWEAGFTVCLGPGEFLTGAGARKAHYRWADIPRRLVHRWTAERRSATQTIRQLEARSCTNSA